MTKREEPVSGAPFLYDGKRTASWTGTSVETAERPAAVGVGGQGASRRRAGPSGRCECSVCVERPWWARVAVRLSTPRVNCGGSCGLWVTIMCHSL